MNRSKSLAPEFDYPLLVLITALIGFGLVMVFSASYDVAYAYKQDVLYFFIRQLIWIVIGLAAFGITLSTDYRTWQTWAVPILILAVALLLLVLIAGTERLGASRQLLNGSIQPSEIAKIAIIIYVAAWLGSKGERLRSASVGLLPFAVLLGLLVGLILLQPDIDTSVVIAFTAIAMFFIAGADLFQVLIVMLLGIVTFVLTIVLSGYGVARVTNYLNYISDPTQVGTDHIAQALTALTKGGVFGRGLSAGTSKLNFTLPMAHTDSIFAVIGEELGLWGTLLVLGLFLFFAYRGTRIALRAPDTFGTLLAFGITTWLVFQALLNMAVMTATIPPSGQTLPFFSYGGSSTVANLAAVGILLNISRGGKGGLRLNAISGFWRRNGRSRVPDSDGRSGTTEQTAGYTRSASRKR